MHYVKLFNINGVDTKQVACIELQGAPNAATEGAVGVLGMDMTSPTHEVYRCVAVQGSVYTWELLSAGMSIISATITGEGGEFKAFPYEKLRIPKNYLIKVGDLILDSEGYLYQISAIGAESCDSAYCGTHIGGIANGDKDYSLSVKDGKLQLVTESGNVISNIDYLLPDEKTITRNSSTGVASVRGINTINDSLLRLFVGTTEEYNALTEEQKLDLFAILTDDTAREDILNGLREHRETYHYHYEIGFNVPIYDGDEYVWENKFADFHAVITSISGSCSLFVEDVDYGTHYFTIMWGNPYEYPERYVGEAQMFFSTNATDYVLTLQVVFTRNSISFLPILRDITNGTYQVRQHYVRLNTVHLR